MCYRNNTTIDFGVAESGLLQHSYKGKLAGCAKNFVYFLY